MGAHHHLVCTSCGRVRDVHVGTAGLEPPDDQRQGFVLGAAEVVFRGQCGPCAAQPSWGAGWTGRTRRD